jgi:hypothetical protein
VGELLGKPGILVILAGWEEVVKIGENFRKELWSCG